MACSDLSTVAQWEGLTARESSATCTYNPPPGWVILDHEVRVESSNNGSRSVSTLAGGGNFLAEEELQAAYDSVIKLAGDKGDDAIKAELENRKKEHLREVRRYQTSHNTLHAEVKAKAHGSSINRKRGWEQIDVLVRLRCLGTADGQALINTLKNRYDLD